MAQVNPNNISFADRFKEQPLLKMGARAVFILLPAFYLAWELFWAWRVGYPCVKWHTHLMLYFYLWITGYYLIRTLFRERWPKKYMSVLTLYTAVIVSLFVTEAALLSAGIRQTGQERIGQGYISPYYAPHESWYHAHPAGKTYWLEKKEYRYIRHANSLGFADMEWQVDKPKRGKYILALGDSFTEGDGAPYDSSYVAQLRAMLLAEDSSVHIMNAGTCGSDPFINFVNFRDRLLPYQPDIILQTLSSGDMNTDIMVRGGFERFRPDGSVLYKKAPFWEPLFAISNLSRLVFSVMGYNDLLMKATMAEEQKKRLDSITADLFGQYAVLAREHNCRLVIILQPFNGEIDAGRYDYDFGAIRNFLARTPNIEVIDLMPFYLAYCRDDHRSIHDYYWPMDGHHNSAGYKMMAEGIYWKIKDQIKKKA